MNQDRPNRRWPRLIALGVLIIMAGMGQLVRSNPQTSDNPSVTLTPMPASQPDGWPQSLRLIGMWEITGNDWRLGGWSALAPTADGNLLAFSDRGMQVEIDMTGGSGAVGMVTLPPLPGQKTYVVDIESAVMEPATGTLWLGLEYHNAVVRFDSSGAVNFRQPEAMKDWPINGGPESMARLPDGRFIVLAESGGGLLFPGDPVDGGEPIRFNFDLPGSFEPTDAIALDDGTLLVLLRSFELSLSPFDAMIVHVDPGTITPGGQLGYTPIADLIPALPWDNYEGLTVTPAGDGTLDLWLASDDNQAALQRSLLVHMNWDPSASTDPLPDSPTE